MLNLYTPIVAKVVEEEKFGDEEKLSVLYHNVFDYPLTFAELIKWKSGKGATGAKNITSKDGYYFLEGRESLVYQRLLRKRISAKKLEIASNATKLLKIISTIRMVAVTGSLSMANSISESDIDLMIVTKKGTLWTTRIIAYMAIWLYGYKTRKPNDKEQKDRLCLNIWMDESDLVFRERNLYTAHEIAQIVPLINKDYTHERFLWKNRWILSYWPSAVKIYDLGFKIKDGNKSLTSYILHPISLLVEKLVFWLQYQYMKSKITREVVTKTRALFHPQDWGKVVLDRLNPHFVE